MRIFISKSNSLNFGRFKEIEYDINKQGGFKVETTTSDLRWIKHSKCVGETAGNIAQKLKLDVDKAMALLYSWCW